MIEFFRNPIVIILLVVASPLLGYWVACLVYYPVVRQSRKEREHWLQKVKEGEQLQKDQERRRQEIEDEPWPP